MSDTRIWRKYRRIFELYHRQKHEDEFQITLWVNRTANMIGGIIMSNSVRSPAVSLLSETNEKLVCTMFCWDV
jgi:hypothetical protein